MDKLIKVLKFAIYTYFCYLIFKLSMAIGNIYRL